MPAFVDYKGRSFGRLIVLERAANKGRYVAWLCKCTCGTILTTTSNNLRSGDTKSCGCIFKEMLKTGDSGRKHGGKGTAEYKVWDSMKQRCLNPRDQHYGRYGGRGITVCQRWLTFDNFLADIGKRPSKQHSLDRINNDGPYAPDNCRWATWEEQNNNHSLNRVLEYHGVKMTMARWARRLEINYATFKWYIGKGLTLTQVIEKRGLIGRI